jgi:hypothetical protein
MQSSQNFRCDFPADRKHTPDTIRIQAQATRMSEIFDERNGFCSAGVPPAFCDAWRLEKLPARRRRYENLRTLFSRGILWNYH